MNKKVQFGYNNEQTNIGYTAWENIGTKYNFNVTGNALGIFYSDKGDKYLLSQITSSFGDNCMVGTIDARKITFLESENLSFLLSNNEPDAESMTISRMLSTGQTKQELASKMSLEQTTGFQGLAMAGIKLVDTGYDLPEEIIICGLEPEHFKNFEENAKNKLI